VLLAGSSSSYLQQLALVCGAFSVLAVSLNLVAGYAGLYSLGHAGLLAIGAYACAVGASKHDISPFLMLPVSVLVTAGVGLVLGGLSLRLGGLYFAIVTLAFSFLVPIVAEDWAFHGDSGPYGLAGVAGLVGPEFPAFPDSLSWLGSSLVWGVAAVVAIAALVGTGVRRSPLHAALLASRDAEPMALAAGVPVRLLRVGTFTLSAALAGLAGWLYAFHGYVSPAGFNYTLSVQVLVMVLLGGIGTSFGPYIGAIFIALFPELVHASAEVRDVIYGLLLLGAIIFVPEGVAGLARKLVRGPFLDRVRPRQEAS
jgi:branched-chain amino acid transport system permease protein